MAERICFGFNVRNLSLQRKLLRRRQPLAVDGDETQIGYAGDAARRTDLLDLGRVVSEAVTRPPACWGDQTRIRAR